MSEHTPGPWEVDYGYADCLVICDTRGDLIEIAAISLDEHGAEPIPEQKANAHLIAAAPELLKACQMEEKAMALFDIWEQSGNSQAAWEAWQHTYHQSIKLRRAAIAKATGETQDDTA